MLVALDLTGRQAARALAQAVRSRTKLEIDPRPESWDDLLWAGLVGRQDELLNVVLHDQAHQSPLTNLIGATCDVRTVISGQLYLFSTFIVEAADQVVPARLALAVPDAIQVANRRHMERKAPDEAVPVRLGVAGSQQPFVVELANISAGGVACRVPPGELVELLLIGDEVHVEFVLPWSGELFALPATVCGKTPCPGREHQLVGFEFVSRTEGPQAADLVRLRASLLSQTARLSNMGDV